MYQKFTKVPHCKPASSQRSHSFLDCPPLGRMGTSVLKMKLTGCWTAFQLITQVCLLWFLKLVPQWLLLHPVFHDQSIQAYQAFTTGDPGSLYKFIRSQVKKKKKKKDFTSQWSLMWQQPTQNSLCMWEARAQCLGSSSRVTASSTAEAK